ncbi:MAG: hypothetical protein ABIJ09_26620 [Pseudomonadota bacterium]
MTTIGTRTGWPFPVGTGLGVSADELKAQQAKPDRDPMLSPIPQVGPTEFLAPTTNSEQLRLQVPTAASPLATPVGPLHDHIYIRKALAKAKGDLSQQLLQFVTRGGVSLPADRQNQIRASLSREQAMFSLLDDTQKMQEQIYGMIIGSAEA